MVTKAAFIVGYGNPWRGDDGVGREVAMALWQQKGREPALAGAVVTWAHQLLPEMALEISESNLAVFVDAANDDRLAGSVGCEPLPGPFEQSGSNPSFGVGCWEDLTPRGLLALALELYGRAPPALLVTVGVLRAQLGTGLSPIARDAVPRAVATVLSSLRKAQPTTEPLAPLARPRA